MSTRQQRPGEQLAPVDEGEPNAQKQKPHQRFPSLVSQARDEHDPDEQKRVWTEAVECLIAMREPGDEADEARVLLAHFDKKALTDAVDQQGRDVHAEAVETLLSLGFPHALKVSPEDLEKYRDAKDSLGHAVLERDTALNYAVGLTAAGHLANLSLALLGTASAPQAALIVALASALLGGLGVGSARKTWPAEKEQQGTLILMSFGALMAASSTIFFGPLGLCAPVLLVLAVAVLATKPPKG